MVLLTLIMGLLKLIKAISFQALLRSDFPWIAELPSPVLVQRDGWVKPQVTKGIGIFAVVAMWIHHFSSTLAILGIRS